MNLNLEHGDVQGVMCPLDFCRKQEIKQTGKYQIFIQRTEKIRKIAFSLEYSEDG
jgi:hypothetical protein